MVLLAANTKGFVYPVVLESELATGLPEADSKVLARYVPPSQHPMEKGGNGHQEIPVLRPSISEGYFYSRFIRFVQTCPAGSSG